MEHGGPKIFLCKGVVDVPTQSDVKVVLPTWWEPCRGRCLNFLDFQQTMFGIPPNFGIYYL